MPEVKLEERIYRVVGREGRGQGVLGPRRVWRYRSQPDALWRATELSRHGELVEFSHADVEWKPAPSSWLET